MRRRGARPRAGEQGPRPLASEQGAALIEAAFATPIFLLLLFGVFEVGLLFRSSLATNNAAQQAARAASVHGATPESDFLVIRAMEHGLAALGLQQVDYVVIFRADGPDDSVPAACISASQLFVAGSASPACNRNVVNDFFAELDDPSTGLDTGNFRCGPTSIDRYWCPTERETSISAGTDYVGVHLQVHHDFATGFFGSSRDLSQTVVIRLEPDKL